MSSIEDKSSLRSRAWCNVSKEELPQCDGEILDYSRRIDLWQREQGPVYHSWLPDIELSNWLHDCPDDTAAAAASYLKERRQIFSEFPENTSGTIRLPETCVYCACPLPIVSDAETGAFGTPDFRRIVVRACDQCGWWAGDDYYRAVEYELPNGNSEIDSQWMLSVACLRRFRLDAPDAPIEELRRYLRRDDRITQVSPRALERLIGSIFSEHLHCGAVHIGGPGDGGIDLILLDAKEPLAVQVKRRSTGEAESVTYVREFLGAMLLAGYKRGLFVTTAPRFSQAAQQAAVLAKKLPCVDGIELVDAKRALDILRSTAVETAPWETSAPKLAEPRPASEPLQ